MGAAGWLLNLGFGGSDPSAPSITPVWLETINQQGDLPMLLKNTASQVVGAQIIDTAGDAQTTGTTTVYVTGDAGTQASGGTAIHEGNGYWSFLPSQANTNYTQVAFTFVNDDTDAIPVTKEYACVSFDYTDTVRMGMTALPNAAAEASGGLFTRGTGAGQINQDANGRIDANVEAVDTSATVPANQVIVYATDFATNYNQTRDAWVTNHTDYTGTIPAAAFAANSLDGKGDWNTTTPPTAAENRAEMDSNSTQLAAIVGDTNELQGDWTNGGRLDLILDAVLALLDDARAEPGQGAPPVNPDAMTKLDYLYKSWRNKKDNDGSTTQLYDDAGTTVDQKQTTSEAAGTVTKAEWATGP